jgi:hypothetical protein
MHLIHNFYSSSPYFPPHPPPTDGYVELIPSISVSVFQPQPTHRNGQHVQSDIRLFPGPSRTHHRRYRVYGQGVGGETAALMSKHRVHIPTDQAQTGSRCQVQTRSTTERYGKMEQSMFLLRSIIIDK